MLAAGMGFVGGYLLATAVAQERAHNTRGRPSPVAPPPQRPVPRGGSKRSSSRPSAATDGQRSSRKPAKRTSKSSRAKKNP